jgi:hypothetical protein
VGFVWAGFISKTDLVGRACMCLYVQNGVLKSLSFLFEYIGEMGKDYIYAVTPLLEDALMDRDLVHRQVRVN